MATNANVCARLSTECANARTPYSSSGDDNMLTYTSRNKYVFEQSSKTEVTSLTHAHSDIVSGPGVARTLHVPRFSAFVFKVFLQKYIKQPISVRFDVVSVRRARTHARTHTRDDVTQHENMSFVGKTPPAVESGAVWWRLPKLYKYVIKQ